MKYNLEQQNKKSVVLLTLNYNNHAETLMLLKSGLNCKEIDKLVVLDNCSEKKDCAQLEKEILKLRNKKIELIKNETNLGFSGGFNFLIKKIKKYDYYILSNSDTILDKNTIKALKEITNKNPEAVLTPLVLKYELGKKTEDLLICPIEYNKKHSLRFKFITTAKNKSCRKIRESENNLIRCSSTGATILFIPYTVFKKAGLLDSNNFFIFSEDDDFFIRLHKNNIPLYLVKNAKTWHPTHSASGNENAFLLHHRIRSKIILYRKYKEKIQLFKYIIYLIFKIISLLIRPKLFKATITAIKEGFNHKIKKDVTL